MKTLQYLHGKFVKTETIKIKGQSIKSNLNILSGKQFDQWVFICPSINVSGYGDTLEDAKASFEYNLQLFMDEFLKLKFIDRKKELKKLGWQQDKFHSKNYSIAYIDKDGILNNLEMPQTLSLETEIA